MKKTGEHTYSLVAGGEYLQISQNGTIVDFHCSDAELICFWVPYFDLDADYEKYINKINPGDKYLVQAANAGSRIHIETESLGNDHYLFDFPTESYYQDRGCIERLCARYGEKKISQEGVEYYGFPTPETLAQASEQDLRELGLGYRARYIAETSRSIASGKVSLEKIFRMKYYACARKELMKLSGVGEKVADCICLFALHHMDAFPIDTHIRQVLEAHYKRGFPNRRYHGMRGIMQQYIFYYELTKGK